MARWSQGSVVEVGAAWGWEMEEMQWRLGVGVPMGEGERNNRSLFLLRGGIFHSLDWGTLSPWFGVAWSQEWRIADLARFEGGVEGGVRLGEEFKREEEQFGGFNVTKIARIWVAIFLRIGR